MTAFRDRIDVGQGVGAETHPQRTQVGGAAMSSDDFNETDYLADVVAFDALQAERDALAGLVRLVDHGGVYPEPHAHGYVWAVGDNWRDVDIAVTTTQADLIRRVLAEGGDAS